MFATNKVPADERAKLVQELLELIKGKVMDIALKHDASRVVQTALQFGNREVNARTRIRRRWWLFCQR